MDRLDKLMAQCRQDVAEIASSESEITSTSNRLLYELASARQTNMTQSVQESVKRNTEAMLNILVTYTTTVDNPSNLSTAPFRSALPAHPSQPDNCRLPTGNDEDGQLVQHDSVSNLQELVQSKCRQIKKTGGLVNIINETIQKEISK